MTTSQPVELATSRLGSARGSASTSSTRSGTGSSRGRGLHAAGHHASTGKGDNQHEEPVGDEAKSPHDVAVGNGETKLGDLAVEGVEPRVEKNETSLLLGLSSELDKVFGGGGGKVESLLVDVNCSGSRKHVDGPDASSTGGPGIAQNRLVIAVEHAHIRRPRQDGKLGSGFVKSLLNLAAVAFF